GALLINDPEMVERAEIIREKGTNRSKFFRGQVDKYTWVDLGSSYLPSELIAAFLIAQLEQADTITARRLALWQRYHSWAAPLEARGLLRRPILPEHGSHNAHMYYLLLRDLDARTHFIEAMNAEGIGTVFHYIPLHSSPAGQFYGRAAGALPHTDATSARLVRLPLWIGLEDQQERVMLAAQKVLEQT
ncbi:MAG: DegT/DnrJ/EryC1/StrS family aminotransferase, partial [Dokdonella sp.]